MTKNAETYANYKKVLESKNVILLVTTGSELLGLKSDNSDTDQLGVFIEDSKTLLGFKHEDTIIYRTAEDRTGKRNEPSKKGDIDLTLYGLRKFLNLALGGNPNLLNLLYAPEHMCQIKTFLGTELQMLAPKIVSRRAADAFIGYMLGQKLRLQGKAGQMGINRPELIEKYGYDVKYATHMLRLGFQGLQLVNEGKLTLPINERHMGYCSAIRSGSYSLNECISWASNLEHDIHDSLEESPLPENPDYDAVETWMITQYLNTWKGNNEVSIENKKAS